MTTVAVLPIKRFAQAKSRLGDVPGKPGLAEQMAAQVLGALCDATGLDQVLVVTADEHAAGSARAAGAEIVAERELLGHSRAARLGVERALELHADRVLLVPGDCPLLRAADVDGLLARHPGPGVVVVPDRHGTGTNALLLSPPDAIGPAFGAGSRHRHERLAQEAGVPWAIDEVPALLLDVDTPEDLEAVRAAQRR